MNYDFINIDATIDTIGRDSPQKSKVPSKNYVFGVLYVALIGRQSQAISELNWLSGIHGRDNLKQYVNWDEERTPEALLKGQCLELATRYQREGPEATEDLVEALGYLVQKHGSKVLAYYTAAGGIAPSNNKVSF